MGNVSSWIDRICAGEDKGLKLNGIWCAGYDGTKNSCAFLGGHMIREMFEQGRCFFVVDECLKREMEDLACKNPTFYIAEIEDINVEGLVKRLQGSSKTGHTMRSWYGYVREAVHNAILDHLRGTGFFLGRKECGTCLHCSTTKPRRCQLEYLPDSDTEDRVPNPLYQFIRKAESEACKGHSWIVLNRDPGRVYRDDNEMHDPLYKVPPGRSHEEEVICKLDYEVALKSLQKRALNAKSLAKRREYGEQYDIFKSVCDLMDEGLTERDAKRKLLEELVKDPGQRGARRRMMSRHIKEARAFLSEMFGSYRIRLK